MLRYFGASRRTSTIPLGLLLMLALGLPRSVIAQSNIDPNERFAWSENAGWANFRPTHGGVRVTPTHLSGFAWAENVGWVKLGADGAGPYGNTGAGDWGVNRAPNGNLSGYAWSENAGWIHFNPTHGQVRVDPPTGAFDGYAWSENLGWIHFRNASPTYGVRQLGADLSITKDDGVTSVVAGAHLAYTLTVENHGPSDSTGGTVADVLPAGLSFVSSPSGCTESGGTVSCPFGSLADGANQVLSFVAAVAPSQTATISNTATVAGNETDPASVNDSSTHMTSVVREANLTVTQTDTPDPVAVDTVLRYDLTITNLGPSNATSITVIDTLPPEVVFLAAGGELWSCGEAGGVVTCTRDALAAQASAPITLEVSAPPLPTTLTNQAQVTASQDDPVNADNSDVAQTRMVAPDLRVTLSGSPDSADAGTPVTYTVTVWNDGTLDAADVAVGGTLVPTLDEVQTSGCAEDPAGSTRCTLGTVPAADSRTYTVSGVIPEDLAGTVRYEVEAAAGNGEGNPGNESDAVETPVRGRVDLALTLDGPQEAIPGTTVVYTLDVTNQGPQAVMGARIIPDLPAELVEVSAPDVFDLAVGATATFELTAQLVPSAAAPLTIRTTAQVPATVVDPDLDDNAAETTAILTPTANLDLSHTDDRVEVVAGKTMIYELKVRNPGPSDAPGVTLRGIFPLNSLEVTCFSDADPTRECSGSGREALAMPAAKAVAKEWTFDLPAGGTRTYLVGGMVPVTEEGILSSNSWLETFGLVDPSNANNQASVQTIVVPAELVAESGALRVSEGRAPDLAFEGSGEAVVIFEREIDGVTRIVSRRLTRTAEAVGEVELVSDGEGINPAIAFDPLPDPETPDSLKDEEATAGGITLKVFEALMESSRESHRIEGKFRNSLGDVLSTIILAQKDTDQRRPDVAPRLSSAIGGFLTVWESARAPNIQEIRGSAANKSGIFGRFVNSPGQLEGDIFRLNSANEPDPLRPAVAATDRGFLVAWDTPQTSGSTQRVIVGQWLRAEGTPWKGEVPLSDQSSSQIGPALACNAELGICLVVWEHREQGLVARLTAANRNAEELLLSDPIPFGKSGDRQPEVTSQPTHFIVVWDRPTALGKIPFQQVIDLEGTLVGMPSPLQSLTSPADPAGVALKADEEDGGTQPSVAHLPNSEVDEGKQVFFVVWSQEQQDSSRRILAQRFALAADLVVTAADSPDPVPSDGSTLTYRVTVTNLGPSAAQNVTVEHSLAAAATPIRLSAACVEDPEVFPVCRLGTLEAGDTRQYELEVALAAAPEGGLSFTAQAGSITPDPYTPDNRATQFTALGDADLAIALAPASSPAVAGERFTWEVTVHNAGPSPAAGVVVRAPLAAGVTLAPTSDCEEDSPAAAACPLGELARGEERVIALVVDLPARRPTPLEQTVRVEALSGDGDLADNQASAEVPVVQPDLAVRLDAPEVAIAGRPLTYTLTVSNRGAVAAADVVARLALPDGLTLKATSGCVEDPAGVPECTLGTVVAPTARRITFEVATDAEVSDRVQVEVSVASASQPVLRASAETRFTAPNPTVLPLLGGRFEVRVDWRDSLGTEGSGRVLPHSENTGFFWFFNPDNVELVVKILDGGAFNGSFWFFYGGLSDVEYTITVTDTLTGVARTYFNPQGEICGQGDTNAFPGADGSLARAPRPRAQAARPHLKDNCVAGAENLCLSADRFRVEVEWSAGGEQGRGKAVAGTADTGFFWFFSPANLELAVKVLDGRAINDKFWVFYGALSDVEYTITVTDTVTGESQSYHNPAGEICGRADTGAF